MNSKFTFASQPLTLFREEAENKTTKEKFSVTRGTLNLLPVGFGAEGFKPTARIYLRDQTQEVVTALQALRVKVGQSDNDAHTPYATFGTVDVEAEVIGWKDFQDREGVPCKEYRLKILAVKRAADNEAKYADELFAAPAPAAS